MKDKLSNKPIAIEYKTNYWINMSLLNKYSITKYNAKILNEQVTFEWNLKQNWTKQNTKTNFQKEIETWNIIKQELVFTAYVRLC